MGLKRWSPSEIVSRQEKFILSRLKRNGKLYAFLRQHRHQLFDDAFQLELEAMYRETDAGKEALPPALMAMVLLLQSYAGASDATAVELSLLDLRWQMGALTTSRTPWSVRRGRRAGLARGRVARRSVVPPHCTRGSAGTVRARGGHVPRNRRHRHRWRLQRPRARRFVVVGVDLRAAGRPLRWWYRHRIAISGSSTSLRVGSPRSTGGGRARCTCRRGASRTRPISGWGWRA